MRHLIVHIKGNQYFVALHNPHQILLSSQLMAASGILLFTCPLLKFTPIKELFLKQLKPKGKKYGQPKLGNRKSQYSGVGPRGKIGPLMEMYLMETKIHTTTIHYLIFCPGPAVQTAAVHKLSIVSDI